VLRNDGEAMRKNEVKQLASALLWLVMHFIASQNVLP
jgi:hypothetical protein